VPGGEGVEGGQGRALDGREERLEALAGLGAIAGALRLIAEAWWLKEAGRAATMTWSKQPRRRSRWRSSQHRRGIALTHFIVSDDVERSRRFYADVLGGETVMEGEPTIVALANGWVIINVGGGPTDDKPTVTLETPTDPDRVSSFLNVRVADIQAIYDDWSARGAEFLTPPQDRGREIRCYLRDPDGHLIEVGQATGVPQERRR
jgi:catechol 2,3-dioxygenase-like lactoylglutathione lyase family enzyme